MGTLSASPVSFQLPPGFLGRLQYLAANRYDLDGLVSTLGQEFSRRRCTTREAIAAIAEEHGIEITVFADDHPAGRRGPASKGEVVARFNRDGSPRKYLTSWGCHETPEDCGSMPPPVQASEREGGRKMGILYRRKLSTHAA